MLPSAETITSVVPNLFRMLELLETEILTGLRLLGLNSLSELDHTYLSKDYAFDTKNVLSAFPLIDEGY